MESPVQISDEMLFSLVKKGNQVAFRQIYERHWNWLYSSVYNVLGEQESTEDVLHDVLIDIWNRKESLEISNLKAYLARAVRNNALLMLRDRKFEELDLSLIQNLSIPPNSELDLHYQDLSFTLDEAMKKLPERCRTIFEMSRFQELSIAEIAAHFSISRRTVENQLHKALKYLRGQVGGLLLMILLYISY